MNLKILLISISFLAFVAATVQKSQIDDHGGDSTTAVVLVLVGRGSEESKEFSYKKKTEIGTVIGINLGSTYSCVGVFKNGSVEIISNYQQHRLKLDTSEGVNTPTPEEISVLILTKIREAAEAYLGKKVTHAVVAVPAHFNDTEKQATKDAGALAGLTVMVMKIIDEPRAAAIAYGLDKTDGEHNILVFNLGDATFDVTLLVVDNGVFEVVARSVNSLSSDNFDDRIMDSFVNQVLEEAGMKKEDVHEIILAGRSTHVPKIEQLAKTTFDDKEPLRGINPEEVVAHGAAILGGILSGEPGAARQEVCGIETTPLTLSIETVGGLMTALIPRDTVIPITKSRIFSTVADNQSTITIQVYEGERRMTQDNYFLGKVELTGIPPAPQGVPRINVTFELDANSILQVSAQDLGTGNIEKVIITNHLNRLSPDEIERMIEDSERFAEDDKIKEHQLQRSDTEKDEL